MIEISVDTVESKWVGADKGNCPVYRVMVNGKIIHTGIVVESEVRIAQLCQSAFEAAGVESYVFHSGVPVLI